MMTFLHKPYFRFAFFLLFLAGMSLFLFQNHVNGFEASHHGFLSSHGMTLAKNLIYGDKPFLMYEYQEVQDDQLFYHAYNRFPLFPFALIGLTIRPFEPALAEQIYAARQLMNFFLLLTMFLLSKLIAELVDDWRVAVTVTLLVGSTTYILRYSDMIFNDIPALFGFVLALYAVVKTQKRSLSSLDVALFALLPITLSWQPYAVFLIWVAVDFVTIVLLGQESRQARRISLFRQSASLKITAWAILWGVSILGWQLFTEGQANSGSSTQVLSSIDAIVRRVVGYDPSFSAAEQTLLHWDTFAFQQAGRILLAMVPFGGIENLLPMIDKPLLFNRLVALLILVTGFFAYLKHRCLPVKVGVILLGSGLLWAFGMRPFVAFHDFQAIYYIGFAILFFLSIAVLVPTQARTSVLLAVCVLFIMSVYQSNAQKSQRAEPLNAVTAEFQKIYDQLPPGRKIYVDGERSTLGIGYHAVNFYVAGSITAPLSEAAYVISENRNVAGVQLTDNPHRNLFAMNRAQQ
jgi:hypothetical protein